jgi:adenylate cyclase
VFVEYRFVLVCFYLVRQRYFSLTQAHTHALSPPSSLPFPGFTNFSAQHSPETVVKLLSFLFSAFDELTDIHRVYKIQTIGDAYVLVGGFPFMEVSSEVGVKKAKAADFADRVICMAFDMLAVIAIVSREENFGVEMRIGVHTGDIIAGVIGTKQLRFDIWGTDCLVANTMESSGCPSGITVSEATANYVRNKYRLVKQGSVYVKGKGDVVFYSVHSPVEKPNYRLNTKLEDGPPKAH